MAADFMSRALALAWTAPEPASPNPTVGAVVVADGEIIGEGVTEPPPGRHAEIVALEQAGERARGAMLYVTLEPCRHFGRTPPCTDAIIAAGIAEVHYAVADPGEKSGGGHAALVATTEDASATWRASVEATGAEVLTFAKHGDHVDLEELLRELARRDVVTALIEGGGVLLGGFFDRGLVDKVYAVIAPIIVGAADAPGAVAGRGADRMADALRMRDITVERLGEDILVTGYPQYAVPPD